MTEIINSYNLDNLDSLIPMDRKEFYDTQVKVFQDTWKPMMAVEVVNIFLFNESWEMILQKRSSHKAHNANLIDKSIILLVKICISIWKNTKTILKNLWKIYKIWTIQLEKSIIR